MGKKAKKANKKSKKGLSPATGREAILVSLQEKPSHLEEVGARHPSERVTSAGTTHVGYAKQDEAALARWGFTAAWRAAMEEATADAKGKSTARQDVPLAAQDTGDAVDADVHNALVWIDEYKAVVENSGPTVREHAPKVGHLSHARKSLAAGMDRLVSFMEKNAAATEAHGGGPAYAQAGRDLIDHLTAARDAHALKRGELPEAERALHAAVGIVYLELARLSRAAKRALPHERARLYTVEQLKGTSHAKGSHGKGAPAPGQAPAPGPTPPSS